MPPLGPTSGPTPITWPQTGLQPPNAAPSPDPTGAQTRHWAIPFVLCSCIPLSCCLPISFPPAPSSIRKDAAICPISHHLSSSGKWPPLCLLSTETLATADPFYWVTQRPPSWLLPKLVTRLHSTTMTSPCLSPSGCLPPQGPGGCF